jgi:uncharacterized protein YlxW (UPF0749 family)
MFGIKIISEKEYKKLTDHNNSWGREHQELGKQIERLRSDNDSLRQQLNDQMAECRKLKQANESLRQFKRDALTALSQIDIDGLRIKFCNTKCARCKHEKSDCRKYVFGYHTFCVIPKP